MNKTINERIFSIIFNSSKTQFNIEFSVGGKTAKTSIKKETLLDRAAQNKPFYKVDFVYVPRQDFVSGTKLFELLGVENGRLTCNDIMRISTPRTVLFRNSELDLTDMTDEESDHMDDLVEDLIQKYLEQGGDPEMMQPKEYIDYHLCMIYYDTGMKAVDEFVRNYKYDPSLPKQPVYHPSEFRGI